MCVIAVVEFARPSDEQVSQMHEQNSKGGGVAWRHTYPDGRTVVRWKKGLNKEEMLEFNRTLEMPYVLHFRIPSTGTSLSHLACHPFVVDDEATSDYEGETEGYVLFHNGFWTDWKTKMQTIAISGYVRIPSGPWSDSRGLAWAASHLGLGFLDIVDEKVVAFGPNWEDIEIYGNWLTAKVIDEAGEDQTMLVSNLIWQKYTPPANTQRVIDLGAAAVRIPESGGTPALVTFPGRSGRPTAAEGLGEDQQEPVQREAPGPLSGRMEGGKATSSLITCVKCNKISQSGYVDKSVEYCWQCWAANRHSEQQEEMHGLCGTCKVNRAGARRYEGNDWLCMPCWETNGKPRIWYRSRKDGGGE